MTVGGFGGRIAEPWPALPSASTLRGTGPTGDYSDQVIVLGRLKPGKVRESCRVVHVFQVAPDLLHNPVVTARCGAPLPTCDLQWLPGLRGMPCEQCVMAG
jgi:hypothetical protein